MKLLFCLKCQDLFKLDFAVRKCNCGACSGKYLEDGLNAVYSGDKAIPVGFANNTFVSAIKNQPEDGWGSLFNAFVIPKVCKTFKKVKRVFP